MSSLYIVRSVLSSGALCVAALGMSATSSPAAAFELFGIRFFDSRTGQEAQMMIADPLPYSVALTINATGELENAVRMASALLANAAEPASGVAGLLARARGDYRRIIAALYNEGHYGGSVSIRVAGREASDLASDARLPVPVDVVIAVDPGPLFRFSNVTIVNQAISVTTPDDYVDPPAIRGFAAGEIARSSVILRAEQLALEAWRQQGHAKAAVISRDVVADHAAGTIDVTIVVNPGALAAFGPVMVTGTERADPDFVRRQTGLVEGQEYDPDDLILAKKRLDRLEVFRSARLEAAEAIGTDGLLPYTLMVQELPGARFGVGVHYASVDGLGIEAYHLWRNLFGQAERLRLDAKVASIAWPLDTANFDYAFGGTFTKPGLLTPDTDLVASIAAERTIYPAYREMSANGMIGLDHVFSDHLAVKAVAAFKRSRFEDIFGVRNFDTANLFSSATLDFRNDQVDATQGWYLAGTLDPFYEFHFGNVGLQATLEGRSYFGFGKGNAHVLATRFKAGMLLGPDLAEISPDRLFFAGGGGSVRGYGFKSIGVDDGFGGMAGGRYLLEGSVEVRTRMNENIGVVGFLDGGYVAADGFSLSTALRFGAGAGLRYYTGFGPLRIDVAVPLNKQFGGPDYAIYAGIGQAF